MILLGLFNHRFIEFFRSKFWKTGIGLKILAFLGFSVFSAELILAGWFADVLIRNMNTGKSVTDVFNSWILLYFMSELGSRFLTQKMSEVKIQPYLLLNIPRSQLVHFLLARSVFSYFNLFFLMAAIPFGIKNLLAEGQIAGFIGWTSTIILAVFTVNFLALLLKTTIGATLLSTTITLVVMAIIALTYIYQWIDFKEASILIFNSGVWSLLFFALLLPVIYLSNFRLKMADIYPPEKSKVEMKLTFLDKWLNGFKSDSVVTQLVIMEIKLIFRNKIPRTVLISSLLFILLGLIFQFLSFMPVNLKIQFLIMGIVGMANGYGGTLPTWESTFYEGLMTKNITFRNYLRAKYNMFFILTLLGFIPLIIILFIDIRLFVGGFCVMLYVAGLNSIAYIGLSSKNRMRVDIQQPVLNKNAGVGSVFGWKMFLSFIPLIIYLPFILLEWYMYGACFLGFLGLLGFLFHRQFIKEFEEKYRENKYLMLEGFRTK